MKPRTVGRVLGIGLRVAGRFAGERAAAHAQAAVNAPTGQRDAFFAGQSRVAGQTAGQAAKGVARGVGGFLRPFRRVGGILWLEVMGVFFFLPVIAFAPTLWRTRASFAHGPDHRTFLVSTGVTVLFLYLGASSFWRARKK